MPDPAVAQTDQTTSPLEKMPATGQWPAWLRGWQAAPVTSPLNTMSPTGESAPADPAAVAPNKFRHGKPVAPDYQVGAPSGMPSPTNQVDPAGHGTTPAGTNIGLEGAARAAAAAVTPSSVMPPMLPQATQSAVSPSAIPMEKLQGQRDFMKAQVAAPAGTEDMAGLNALYKERGWGAVPAQAGGIGMAATPATATQAMPGIQRPVAAAATQADPIEADLRAHVADPTMGRSAWMTSEEPGFRNESLGRLQGYLQAKSEIGLQGAQAQHTAALAHAQGQTPGELATDLLERGGRATQQQVDRRIALGGIQRDPNAPASEAPLSPDQPVTQGTEERWKNQPENAQAKAILNAMDTGNMSQSLGQLQQIQGAMDPNHPLNKIIHGRFNQLYWDPVERAKQFSTRQTAGSDFAATLAWLHGSQDPRKRLQNLYKSYGIGPTPINPYAPRPTPQPTPAVAQPGPQ